MNKFIAILENHSEYISFSLSIQEKRGIEKERETQIHLFKKPELCRTMVVQLSGLVEVIYGGHCGKKLYPNFNKLGLNTL